MRPQLIASTIVLCICVSGCRLAADITHNVVFETCLFVDEVKGKAYYRILAHSAWKEYRVEHPERGDSKDFAKGFKLGYVEYLEGGGDGSGHPLPPLRYWKVRHETPEGRAATLSWLEGFREGTASAKAHGYRELIVVPVGNSGSPPENSPSPTANSPLLGNPIPVPTPPVTPDLPAPRSLPDVSSPKSESGNTTPAGTPLQPTGYCPSNPSGSVVAPTVSDPMTSPGETTGSLWHGRRPWWKWLHSTTSPSEMTDSQAQFISGTQVGTMSPNPE